jgi:cobalt-zinc-cadmium resistance protein CzcA
MLPLAALATFIADARVGLSANLMSLGGLAIAIGMLVDAAVVVVENVETQLSADGAAARQPLLHLVFRATREVAAPVASGILIIIIVFLPLLTLEGLEGKTVRPGGADHRVCPVRVADPVPHRGTGAGLLPAEAR